MGGSRSSTAFVEAADIDLREESFPEHIKQPIIAYHQPITIFPQSKP